MGLIKVIGRPIGWLIAILGLLDLINTLMHFSPLMNLRAELLNAVIFIVVGAIVVGLASHFDYIEITPFKKEMIPSKEKQISEETLRCPNCGNKVEPDDMFCANCGNKLR